MVELHTVDYVKDTVPDVDNHMMMNGHTENLADSSGVDQWNHEVDGMSAG